MVTVDFRRAAANDALKSIVPKLKGDPFFSVVPVLIVDPVCNAALPLAAMVQDALTDVFRNAEPTEIGSSCSPKVVHGDVGDAKLGSRPFHCLANAARCNMGAVTLAWKHVRFIHRCIQGLLKQPDSLATERDAMRISVFG